MGKDFWIWLGILWALSIVLTALITRMVMSRFRISRKELEGKYVSKPQFQELKDQQARWEQNLEQRQERITELSGHLAAANTQVTLLKEQFANQEQSLQQQFERLASKVLDQNSQKIHLQNQQQLDALLKPFGEKIQLFESRIQQTYLHETNERISLKKEIEQLRDLNQQLSDDANNLVKALTGDTKLQGDWGELRLDMLLTKSGLTEGLEYRKQVSLKDANGKTKRPDFVINLPEGKNLIIDSKVSLKAYDRYCQEEDPAQKAQHLNAHVNSLRQHVKDLSKKNYPDLYEINSPDYVMLYVPIEPAFTLAIQENQQLFTDALDLNIVFVSNSTLLATLKTVAYIWTQEKQKHYAIEIARESGRLYDKFVNFVDDLKDVGKRIDDAQVRYEKAMNKLSDGKGNLLSRAEKIKNLGAKASKQLPEDLVQKAINQPLIHPNGSNETEETDK
ncbi:MAG: DNA recombination protein RmuC [Bacteroidota bacterium]